MSEICKMHVRFKKHFFFGWVHASLHVVSKLEISGPEPSVGALWIFRVIPRFHPSSVKWNIRLTWKFLTPCTRNVTSTCQDMTLNYSNYWSLGKQARRSVIFLSYWIHNSHPYLACFLKGHMMPDSGMCFQNMKLSVSTPHFAPLCSFVQAQNLMKSVKSLRLLLCVADIRDISTGLTPLCSVFTIPFSIKRTKFDLSSTVIGGISSFGCTTGSADWQKHT